tara:strand:- start:7082 stop:7336 length:255 start_codon:yes stop_codon:yes gene_type:complete
MSKEPLIEQLFKNKKNMKHPKVVVSGSGDAWFLNPETRSMERIFRGSVVQRVSPGVDNKGRYLVKLGTIYMLIPADELFGIGEN